MPRGRKKKDKYEALPSGFKEAVDGMSTDEIKKRVSQIAILDMEMRQTLKDDEEVQLAKSRLKNLMEPYREDFKSFKLQMQYAKEILDAKDGGASTAAAEEKKS